MHGVSQGYGRVAYRHTVHVTAILALTVSLAACQTDGGPPALTLEEAKKVTATFEESSFTPPPRTIKDITAILDKEKRADPAAAAKALAEANKEPPAGAPKDELASFYWQRGKAAGKIGDVRKQLTDLKEAVRLSKGTSGATRGRFLFDLGIAEVMAGSWADSTRNLEEAFKNIPPEKRGRKISWGSSIARLSASAGDLEKADQYFAEAESLFNQAQGWRSWGQWGDLWTRQIRRAEGRILMFKGRYAEAEPVLRAANSAAERALSKQTHEADAFILELTHIDLSRLLRRQGRLVEAEIEARKALTSSLRRVGRYSQDTAYMLRRLAETIGAQGRNQEAGQLSRAAIDIYRQTGTSEDSFMMATVRNQLAGSLVNQGLWDEALAEFDAVKKGMAGDPKTFEQFFAHDLGWALALVSAGRGGEAKSIAEAALRRNERLVGKDHYDTASSLGVLAMALAGMDKRKEAFSAFSQAIPILLSGSRQSDDETTTQAARERRLGMILETYVGLLADVRGTALEREAGIDAIAEAFRIAGMARGQSVQRALGASAARAAAKDPALADLVRREQDTQKQLGAYYGLLAAMLAAPTDQQNPKAAKSLRARIDKLRGARVALAKEIEKGFPAYAQLMNPKPATIEQARAVLRPGEALIATYVGEERTYVWAIPHRGEVSFAAADMGREELEDTVEWLRAALEPNARTLGDIPDFDLAVAHALYKKLLEPVKAGWRDADSLLVVAHGALGYLPLSLLPTGPAKLAPEEGALFANYRDVPWLVRTHAVTVLPSVASLKTLRGLPPPAAGRKAFAGFGDPYFSRAQAAEAARPKKVEVAALTSRGLRTRGLPVRLRAAP
ncbi:MAG: tetratricopeptide repeat protein, partial [Alphaproteobacteria bacterium]